MKMMKSVVAVAILASTFGAAAHSTTGPTAYDKTQDSRINQAFADINTTYAYVNTKYTEAAGKALEGQVKDLKADQVRQDNQTAANLKDQQVRDTAQDQAIKAADDRGLAGIQIGQIASGMAANAGQLASQVKKTVEANAAAQQTRDAGQDVLIQQAHEKADAGAVRADNIEKNLGNVQEAAQIANDRASGLEIRVGAGEEKNASQDQHINAVQNAAQIANEKADSGAVRMDGIETRATVTDNRSINNAVRIDGVEKANSVQDQQIADETRNRLTGEKKTAQQISTETQNRIAGDQLNAQQIAAANENIEVGRQAQAATNQRVDRNTATLSNHESRIGALEESTNSKFRNIDRRFGDMKKRIDAGVSAAMASAGIPQVTEYQTFAVGAAVGGYENGNALAVGFSARASQNVVLKGSVATDNNHGFGYNAGVSVGW